MNNSEGDMYRKVKSKPVEETGILIVDDNRVDRKVISTTLERAGYKVETAENGQEGLEKADEVKPDVIILDCEMPVMGGIEMCTKLKEKEGYADIPVIFLTSIDTPKNIIECFETDAENFLTKPVNAHVLLGHIETIMETSEDIHSEI